MCSVFTQLQAIHHLARHRGGTPATTMSHSCDEISWERRCWVIFSFTWLFFGGLFSVVFSRKVVAAAIGGKLTFENISEWYQEPSPVDCEDHLADETCLTSTMFLSFNRSERRRERRAELLRLNKEAERKLRGEKVEEEKKWKGIDVVSLLKMFKQQKAQKGRTGKMDERGRKT